MDKLYTTLNENCVMMREVIETCEKSIARYETRKEQWKRVNKALQEIISELA